MSLGDKIHESEIFDILHFEDSVTVQEAKTLLKTAPTQNFIQGDNIDKIWFDSNIQSQEKLCNLKIRIDSQKNDLFWESKKLQGAALDSNEYEFIKNKDDRFCTMIHRDEEIRDLEESIAKLTSLSSYVDNLVWNLRDLLKLFKR